MENDTQNVKKLMHAFKTGGLRKRRGGALDLSDSEDDEERRDRARRKLQARRRQKLMEDQNISQIGTSSYSCITMWGM